MTEECLSGQTLASVDGPVYEKLDREIDKLNIQQTVILCFQRAGYEETKSHVSTYTSTITKKKEKKK